MHWLSDKRILKVVNVCISDSNEINLRIPRVRPEPFLDFFLFGVTNCGTNGRTRDATFPVADPAEEANINKHEKLLIKTELLMFLCKVFWKV